jgi:hypothetical protein
MASGDSGPQHAGGGGRRGKEDTGNDPNPKPSTMRCGKRYLRSCSVPDECFRVHLLSSQNMNQESHSTGEHVTTSATQTSLAIGNIGGLSIPSAIQGGCCQEEDVFRKINGTPPPSFCKRTLMLFCQVAQPSLSPRHS